MEIFSRSDKSPAYRDSRRFSAGVDAELGEEVGDVSLHGAGADEERLADLAIGVSLHQQAQHVQFAGRQAETAGVAGHGWWRLQGGGGERHGVGARIGERERPTLVPGGGEHRLWEAR